jgi:hypothetical protein
MTTAQDRIRNRAISVLAWRPGQQRQADYYKNDYSMEVLLSNLSSIDFA